MTKQKKIPNTIVCPGLDFSVNVLIPKSQRTLVLSSESFYQKFSFTSFLLKQILNQLIVTSMTSSDINYLSVDQIKMEPLDRATRKRRVSQSSMASSVSSSFTTQQKKIKKYEMDPTFDHTVRNARAAKANRDKKKQEDLRLKEENRNYKIKVDNLEKALEKYRQREIELTKQLEQEKLNNLMMKPLEESLSIQSTLESIMPALNAKYGGMTMGYCEESLFPQTTANTTIDETAAQLSQDDAALLMNLSLDEDISFSSDFEFDDKYSIPTEADLEPSLPLQDCSQLLEQNGDPILTSLWTSSNPSTCHVSLKDHHVVVQHLTLQCPPNLWPVLKSMALTPMGLKAADAD